MRNGAPERARPDLWGALASLDERQRAVVVMTCWDGVTSEEIAKIVGVGQQYISRILAPALYAMKNFFDDRRKTIGRFAVGK